MFRNKTGKIIVNGYGTWRKYYKMDFSNLILDYGYNSLPPDEFVYNRKGEQLFFYGYKPEDIKERVYGLPSPPYWYAIYDQNSNRKHFASRGLDSDGIPCFSHYTMDRCANGSSIDWMEQYEPLTVRMVIMWFDWLMMNKIERINL